ncbi:hypothetical protein VOLCADRAFT_107856 [Volvox carteri f. nagariensis]|uniref:Uncharacterized protein n=1 Tax=Volvox carteri f. nagariensis TaxID=3068 RepID=D8UGW1_VOLCA|nr:uncharacterized protein VOLCADRAFT_107856 [Volvox carteri f. nagariensis]EFJ41020.1 hypothetical protein VOLCADRAFT_107856 [Volvox carteri f. nagariensis]|eukprot:XP_002957884.1 hypothetical protein VOLCADRAFT_107856 [Volvox carteri f. nagariensis]
MDAVVGLEELFAAHSAVPALDVLQHLRKDVGQQQAQALLNIHREYLQLSRCSFGRRGRPSYALRTEADVQRLCSIAKISDEDTARFWATDVGQRLRGPHGAAAVREANTHDGSVRGDVSDTGTTNTSSMRIDEQPTGVHVGNAEPSSSTGQLRVPLYARSDISNCAVVPLDAHTTCLDCMRHGLIAAGATDVPAPEILLATVVAAIAECWESMRFQVLHTHASSLPSTCTATQYGEALQQHRLLPGDVELAVLAHAFNIAITVFDPAGLQICYWGSSSAPTEVCLIRQAGLAGAPLPYRLLDMVPGVWTGQRRQHLVVACRAVGLCMSETPSAERAGQVCAVLQAMDSRFEVTVQQVLVEWADQHEPAVQQQPPQRQRQEQQQRRQQQHQPQQRNRVAAQPTRQQHHRPSDGPLPSPAVTDAEQHIPGYFGASWRSGPGHRLGISDRLAAWSAVTSMLLASALVVCAMCGVTSTDLHDDLKRWATVEPVGAGIAPYSFHNSLHAGSTTTHEGLWHLCPHCAPLYPANSGNERAEYLVFHPPDYTKAIVSLDAIDQLRIGLVDVGLGFFSAAFGFVAGKLRQQHCMEALVLDWARDSTRRVNTLPPALQEVLGWSVQHNPLVREFLTVAEQVPPNHPLPYLCPADVQSFVASEQACKPLVLATLDAAEAARSLISVVVPAIQRAAMKHAPVMYTAGTLVPWSPTLPELNLAVAADGTPLDYQFGLSAEMAMFPYLFPFGFGAFMGGTTLVKYLAYRAKCLFSVWTLCKPYLLLMYVLRQSARLQDQNTEAVLESALLDYKSQHPNVSDEDAIRHILKHKLPATLPNTPAWHRSNLQDLLCMVDRFGMPSFFLTLTTDEVSATRWPEVETLEQKLQEPSQAPPSVLCGLGERGWGVIVIVLDCDGGGRVGAAGTSPPHCVEGRAGGRRPAQHIVAARPPSLELRDVEGLHPLGQCGIGGGHEAHEREVVMEGLVAAGVLLHPAGWVAGMSLEATLRVPGLADVHSAGGSARDGIQSRAGGGTGIWLGGAASGSLGWRGCGQEGARRSRLLRGRQHRARELLVRLEDGARVHAVVIDELYGGICSQAAGSHDPQLHDRRMRRHRTVRHVAFVYCCCDVVQVRCRGMEGGRVDVRLAGCRDGSGGMEGRGVTGMDAVATWPDSWRAGTGDGSGCKRGRGGKAARLTAGGLGIVLLQEVVPVLSGLGQEHVELGIGVVSAQDVLGVTSHASQEQLLPDGTRGSSRACQDGGCTGQAEWRVGAQQEWHACCVAGSAMLTGGLADAPAEEPDGRLGEGAP